MPTPVVSDTGPIIHLDEANALSLLSVFETIHVPETVIRELEEGTVPAELADLDVEVHDIEDAEKAHPNLDPGETAALLLAERTDMILLTDDLDARETAVEREIEAHGSIGVVLYAHARGRLDSDEAKILLRALAQETTLYLSRSLLRHAIRVVEENESSW